MIKIILIFIAGIVETFIYTCYLIAVNKNKVVTSSLTLITYMFIYLVIVSVALKDINGILLIAVYALSNGVGNFVRMKMEKDKKKLRKFWKMLKSRPKGKGK